MNKILMQILGSALFSLVIIFLKKFIVFEVAVLGGMVGMFTLILGTLNYDE